MQDAGPLPPQGALGVVEFGKFLEGLTAKIGERPNLGYVLHKLDDKKPFVPENLEWILRREAVKPVKKGSQLKVKPKIVNKAKTIKAPLISRRGYAANKSQGIPSARKP